MAIQIRRGPESEFDASKMVSGELGVSTDGSHKVWATGAAGDSWELMNEEDVDAKVAAEAAAREQADTALRTAIDAKADASALTAETEAREEAITDLKADLEQNYAQKDGVYPDLAAGIIATDKHTSDATPYLFRPTGGSKDVGNREYVDAIVGGTVAWNQFLSLVSSDTVSGVTFAITNGVITFSGTATADITKNINNISVSCIKGHKYLLLGISGGSQDTYSLKNNYYGVKFYKESIFWPIGDVNLANYSIIIKSGTNMDGVKIVPQIIDLTQMFGTEIADYLYQLESATAGSGIAKLKEWGFDLDTYHEYNPGSLESVSGVSAHVMRDAENNVIGTYPLDSTLTLRGIPKLSEAGDLYYDGDRYLPNGTVERRYGVRAYQSGDESLADAITDGTNTVYKLTTPTTETADHYTSYQVCDHDGTEEYITTGGVPVGHETKYPLDLVRKIEDLYGIPTAPTTDGTYTLKAVVTSSGVEYQWVSE